jgi:hypothetical protein
MRERRPVKIVSFLKKEEIGAKREDQETENFIGQTVSQTPFLDDGFRPGFCFDDRCFDNVFLFERLFCRVVDVVSPTTTTWSICKAGKLVMMAQQRSSLEV